jgi:transcriptional regulator with XRE-family HTH domain
MESNVQPIRQRMTADEYEQERTQLRALYGASSAAAAAKRDQALALLFYRSGWTQEELAEKERMSQTWVNFRLRFGRFLNFITTVIKSDSLPNNLTEGRFRSFWEQTDKAETNERIRFRMVQQLMADHTVLINPRRKKIGKELVQQFADGRWYKEKTIAGALNAECSLVFETLDKISKEGTYGATAERKRVGQHYEWRIFKTDRTISLHEMIEKLAPILKGLEAEGKKNMATMSPGTVAHLTWQIQQLLKEWAE